jgi:hypothetical protein
MNGDSVDKYQLPYAGRATFSSGVSLGWLGYERIELTTARKSEKKTNTAPVT